LTRDNQPALNGIDNQRDAISRWGHLTREDGTKLWVLAIIEWWDFVGRRNEVVRVRKILRRAA
jgi:hypothetical protein